MLTSLSGARILLVEDHQTLREDLQSILESEGYQVKACGSGLEALELAHQHTFELVVSDVRMGGMDGLEAIERLQQHAHGQLATLVITGYTAEADSIRAVRLGVGDYLKKPFDLVDFLAVVARLLRSHRDRQMRQQIERNLRKTAGWALEQLQASLEGSKVDAVPPQRAQAIALQMGLSSDAAWQSQVLTWIGLCLKARPLDTGELPDDLKHLLQELKDEESPSLLTQIARVSLSGQAPDEPQSALHQAFQRVSQRPAPNPGSQRNFRLREAQAKENFDPPGARQGYLAVLQEDCKDGAELEALLGLMRLDQQQAEACLRWGEAAVTLSRSLSGMLTASTSFEVGLALQRCAQVEQARSLFESTGRIARELSSPLWEARAILALQLSGQKLPESLQTQALSFFTDVSHRLELLESASWLAPGLLLLQQQKSDPLLERALTLLGRDAPGSLLRAALPPAARQSMLNYLPDPSLRTLLEDSDPEIRQRVQARLGATPGDQRPPLLRILAMGAFEVYRGDERLQLAALKSLKQRFMLCRLALAGRPLNPEVVIEEFWPDSLESGRSSLNVCVSNLRKALKPADWPGEVDYLKRDNSGVYLNPELAVWIDARELLEILESNPQPDQPEWKRAVQLYRGPFLEECYMDWAVSLRQTLEIRITQCLGDWLAQLASPERAAETLDYAQRLIQLDDCSQEGYLAAMRAHLWQGRPEWAIRLFETCQKTLMAELGAEPGLALLETYQRARLSLPH